ncbi:hypothetical protein HDU86_001089 [Geranomyces michiganensis]|nr:hypothetical protein HDU86_001089 [Geranomyces michiganensis]
MSRLSTALRGLTVCLGQEGLPAEDEAALLKALFLLADRLTLTKTHTASVNPTPTFTVTTQESAPLSPAIPASLSTKLSLPTELLPTVFAYLAPGDLYTCLLVSRRWHRTAIPELYRTPRLSSLRAVEAFLKLISSEQDPYLWPYVDLVRRIYFTAEDGAALAADCPGDCDFLSRSCSSLFRFLIFDRRREPDAPVHPLFFTLAHACRHLEGIEETAFTPDDPLAISETNGRIPARGPDDFILTQTVLANLLVSCRHAARTAQLLSIPASRLAHVCTTLLELFKDDARAVWAPGASEGGDGSQVSTLSRARASVLARCRIVLNQLSSAMYLEAQYLALSAQRLLDRYALAYCRGFAAGRRLDVEFAAREARRDTIRGRPGILTQALRIVFRQPLCTETPADLVTPFQDDDHNGSDDGCGETIAATSNIFPSAEFLEGALSVFPPAGMNAETAELVAELLEQHERVQGQDISSPESPRREYTRDEDIEEHARWIAWLQDIVGWSRGAAEMEEVKDALRASMTRMEFFRGLQVKYRGKSGLKFAI